MEQKNGRNKTYKLKMQELLSSLVDGTEGKLMIFEIFVGIH